MPSPRQMLPKTMPVSNTETVKDLKKKVGQQILHHMSLAQNLVFYRSNGEML